MANAKSITRSAKVLAAKIEADIEAAGKAVETLIIRIIKPVEHDGEKLLVGQHYEIEADTGLKLVAAGAAAIPPPKAAEPTEPISLLAPAAETAPGLENAAV